MKSEPRTLIYLYGIVPADATEPPEDLLGLAGRPAHLLRVGTIAAVVSGVPMDVYSDDALNARLDDLAWVGARGVEHERVLDWYAERGAVLPLSLFSLHKDLSRVEQRLRAEEEDFARLLDRVGGRKEWGIKLWRREAEAIEGIDRLSVSLGALNEQIAESPPGKRFLLEKKRDSMRTEEVRTLSARLAHDLFVALEQEADGAASVPLPGGVAGGERTLLLHAAYLVPEDGFGAFQQAVTEQATLIAGTGFELEFTGPWPPYHFTDLDDE